MPSQVAHADQARGGHRRAEPPGEAQRGAAGPISSAVDRIAPTASDDRPTARARASMYSRPTSRTGTPRAAAMSALTVAQQQRPVDDRHGAEGHHAEDHDDRDGGVVVVKIEPNRICWAAPVVAAAVVSR